MAVFRYRARRRESGALVTGEINQLSPREAAAALSSRGLVVVELRERAATRRLLPNLFQTRVTPKERAIFYRQLATMIRAGLPLVVALAAIRAQSRSRLRMCLAEVEQAVRGGEALYEALAAFPEDFPRVQIEMIRAAENAGLMDSVLERLALETEREVRLREKTRSALTYPAVVVLVTGTVLLFIMGFVLPTFESMLAGMGVSPPLLTRLLFSGRDVLLRYWYWAAALLILLLAAVLWWLRTPTSWAILDRALLKVPLVGPLVQLLSLSRFARSLSALLKSGIPLLTGLRMAAAVCGNRYYEGIMNDVSRQVEDGTSLAQALEATQAVPPLMLQMVIAGENTGLLDEMLAKVADFYEAEAESRLSDLASLLEPVLILFVGGIIGLLALTVFLPVFTLINSVSTKL